MQGKDELIYSAVGDAYTRYKIETTTTDNQGITEVVSEEWHDGVTEESEESQQEITVTTKTETVVSGGFDSTWYRDVAHTGILHAFRCKNDMLGATKAYTNESTSVKDDWAILTVDNDVEYNQAISRTYVNDVLKSETITGDEKPKYCQYGEIPVYIYEDVQGTVDDATMNVRVTTHAVFYKNNDFAKFSLAFSLHKDLRADVRLLDASCQIIPDGCKIEPITDDIDSFNLELARIPVDAVLYEQFAEPHYSRFKVYPLDSKYEVVVSATYDKDTSKLEIYSEILHNGTIAKDGTIPYRYKIYEVTFGGTEVEISRETTTDTVTTTTTVKNYSGWEDDSNDDSTSKWLEIGYKDDGDILKAMPIAGDIAVFKTNGRVYTVSGEYPNWNVQQVAEHTDVANADAIVDVGSDIVFMTKLGLKSLQTTAMYGNFTTNETARKINRNLMGDVENSRTYNLIRKRQLIIFPNTEDDEHKKDCYCYQYDLGAGVFMHFDVPIEDMVDAKNEVLVASGGSIMRWSFDYKDDNGTPIEQEIVTKEISSSSRLYSRKVDVGVKGTEAGDMVDVGWANKIIHYPLGAKRRVINVFSVCRESALTLKTKATVAIDYIKLFLWDGE